MNKESIKSYHEGRVNYKRSSPNFTSNIERINKLLIPWNYQKTIGSLMIPRGIEVN